MYQERAEIEMRFSNKVVGSCTVQLLLDCRVSETDRAGIRDHVKKWLKSQKLNKKKIPRTELQTNLRRYLLDHTSIKPVNVGFYYGEPKIKILGPAPEEQTFVWEF